MCVCVCRSHKKQFRKIDTLYKGVRAAWSNLDHIPYMPDLTLRQRSPRNENDICLGVYPPPAVEHPMIGVRLATARIRKSL